MMSEIKESRNTKKACYLEIQTYILECVVKSVVVGCHRYKEVKWNWIYQGSDVFIITTVVLYDFKIYIHI